jgi:cellulose synthase operon protein C
VSARSSANQPNRAVIDRPYSTNSIHSHVLTRGVALARRPKRKRTQHPGRVCFRAYPKALIILAIVLFTLAAQAAPPSWLQWLPESSAATTILYRVVPTLAGPTPVRRPPRETTPELAQLSARSPQDQELIAVTAREYEGQLDFVNAEAQWKRFTSDPIALADYYHRRMQAREELATLTAAAAALPAIQNPIQADSEQPAWKLHERIQNLIQAEAMPPQTAIQNFEAWLTQYPQTPVPYRRYFDFLIASGMLPQASQLLARYQRTFPNDRVFPIHARAQTADKSRAIGVYDAAFDPLWPNELLEQYFKLLTDSHQIFAFYQKARQDATARPLDLAPAARLFHYYRLQADIAAARRELAEFRIRKDAAQAPWTAAELRTLATLSDSVNDYDETVRYSYALYSLMGADAASVEAALVQMISTLLKAPDQPVRFGQGNLSMYRDIATMDDSPGFLNGILSLIFNSQRPDEQFNRQEEKSQAYFHRARAADLYTLLSARFPQSTRRSELLSRLIEGYALYGEDDAIIREGTAFISEFADAPQRTRVALQIADAYARRRQVPEELSTYDRLLSELAAKAQRVPLGTGNPRSAEYAQILQRYISRLTQLNRTTDALALYRREIDRNPNDPGLYDQLAGFLGANQRAPEIEQVYRTAIQRFQEPSWSHKLARFYLRNRQANELRTLSRTVVNTFSGADLEAYMNDVVADGSLERRMQVEINVYAQARFPHDLTFLRNLISLYSSGATADSAALTRLLSDHWYEDEGLRRMYFERLAAGGSLQGTIQNAVNLLPEAARVNWTEAETANPAITRFIAEASAWQSHFETAAPIMRAVADAYPSDPAFAGRATDVYRSLAAYDAANTAIAVSIAENLSRSEPRDRERLIRIGEIYADRDLMEPAVTVWNRLRAFEPGDAEGYLEAATLFWDYLRPADALNWLQRGRTQLKNPYLWTYETGAILESQGRTDDAVREYLAGALAGNNPASNKRLLRLATRADYRKAIDEQTGKRLQDSPADPQVLALRVSVLREQQRQPEIEPLLTSAVSRTSSREILGYVRQIADEAAMRALHESVIRREIELESDPQQRLRLRIELAHFLESGGRLSDAQREMEAVYRDNPLISGVIRAMADYYWRHDKPRAIQVLAAAAERAHPAIRSNYLIETVRKSIEAMQYADAIQAADSLLRMDPINGQFIALKADALASSGRDAEVQQLYAAKIPEIQQSPISQNDKTDRIAAMRRGLIPVYVKQGKFREAIDQYVEIINRYPDDTNVISEAARLAAQHDLKTQLIGFYTNTVANSPRDPRWAIVLARINIQFEDYPAAIDAYTKAIAARPERQDLAEARADLEERTFRFADAIATYNRIYELSHGKAIWLERIAALQARLGQDSEAVVTLRRAYIDNRPDISREYSRVALILERTGLIDDAANFMQQQAASTGVGAARWESAYARIMTRARRHSEAIERVVARHDPNVAAAMGAAVAEYFTPEERQSFAALLTSRRTAAPITERPLYLNIANAARLYDLEVRWRLEQAASSSDARSNLRSDYSFNLLQERRMQFAALARDLETLAATSTDDDERRGLLAAAMQQYQVLGDSAGELQLLTRHRELQANYRSRYYELLAAAQPDQLLSVAARRPSDSLSLLATQALLAANDSMRALQAVRNQSWDPVWADAYTGIVALYFGVNNPEVSSAFQRALGPQLVQDSVGKTVNRSNQLAGDVWFYYGQRYGELLRNSGQTQAAADYLSSLVESRAGDPSAYFELARYYSEAGAVDLAVTEFRHTLELDANRPDVHSNIAALLWDAGRPAEALAEWKVALEKMAQRPEQGLGASVLRQIRTRQQAEALRREIDTALRAAARAQQVWQLPVLFEALFESSADTAWLLDLAQASTAPGQLLSNMSNAAWLTDPQKKAILQKAVDLLSASSRQNDFEYQQMRLRYLEYLITHKEPAAARQVLQTFSEPERRAASAQQAEIRISALDGTLESLLQRYRVDPNDGPPEYVLQDSAARLARATLEEPSRQLLVYLYSRQIADSTTNTAAFLGLAEIRLKQGRASEAIDLLRRLNLLAVTPFENLLPSARVLSAADRSADAIAFLKLRLQAVPWDDEARLELAKAQMAANVESATAVQNLQAVIRSRRARYDLRTDAARRTRGAQTATAGSRELDLLSGLIPTTAAAAEMPYLFAARVAAAGQTTDSSTRVRLLLGAVAERPDDKAVRNLLFSAALEAKQYHTALAAYRRERENDSEAAAAMGEAHLQIGNASEAARFFGIAASGETDARREQTLRDRQKQARADADRLIENERRRPVIRAELDQPEAVHRRLP